MACHDPPVGAGVARPFSAPSLLLAEMVWLEIVGWVGSLLVIVSLMQARVLRFRVINLAGAVIATAYNVVIEIWPFAVMNGVIAVIDVYWLVRLHRERHDAEVYGVLEVPSDDAVLQHLIDVARPRHRPVPPGVRRRRPRAVRRVRRRPRRRAGRRRRRPVRRRRGRAGSTSTT